jgi:hypothetical protein
MSIKEHWSRLAHSFLERGIRAQRSSVFEESYREALELQIASISIERP